MRDDEILDSYDKQMAPYYADREYDRSQKLIDLHLNSLVAMLTEDQHRKLVELLNALSDDYARTAKVAFVTGVRFGRQPPEE